MKIFTILFVVVYCNFIVPLDINACKYPDRLGDPAIGQNANGGWYICKDNVKHGACTILSFGIADAFSFDVGVSNQWKCVVHGFDPTVTLSIKREFDQDSRRKLHLIGIGEKTYRAEIGKASFRWPGMGYLTQKNDKPWEMQTLIDTFKRLNLAFVDVIKMDVEGAEWYVMDQIINRTNQFLVELHFHPNRYQLSEAVFGSHKHGFRIDMTSPDDMNYVGMLKRLLDHGFKMWHYSWNGNNCVEVSFIKG